MVQFSCVIHDELGLHARPAGLLAKLAAGFKSSVTIKCGKGEADAKRLIAMMKLGIQQNDKVEFIVSGDDEKDAAAAVQQFIKDNL